MGKILVSIMKANLIFMMATKNGLVVKCVLGILPSLWVLKDVCANNNEDIKSFIKCLCRYSGTT